MSRSGRQHVRRIAGVLSEVLLDVRAHRNDHQARGHSLVQRLCGQHTRQPLAAIFFADHRVVENPLVRPDVVHVRSLADHGVVVEHFEAAAFRVVPDGDRGQLGLLGSGAWARFGLAGGCWTCVLDVGRRWARLYRSIQPHD